MEAFTSIVKVKYFNNDKIFSRKVPVDRNIDLDDFHEKIRSRFGLSSGVQTEIYYRDEDNDRISITYDDELFIALKSSILRFELLNKPGTNGMPGIVNNQEELKEQEEEQKEPKEQKEQKVQKVPRDKIPKNSKFKRDIKAKIIYPATLRGNVGDFNEVVFKSKYLINKDMSDSVWGTKVYTSDSDYLNALVHSYPVELTNVPPPYNIIATVKILPGQNSYLGTISNEVKSGDYGAWDSSFTFEDIRYESI